MSISGSGRGHRLEKYQSRLHDIQYRYVSLQDLAEFAVPGQDTTSIQDKNFPYPALSVTDTYDLHLVPKHQGIKAWIVESDTDDILARWKADYGFWLSKEGRSEFTSHIISSFNNYADRDLPRDFATELDLTLRKSEELQDPFNQELVEKLRPPTVRLLRQQTSSVIAEKVEYTGGEYIKTGWEIELESQSHDENSITWTLDDYHTNDLVQPTALNFDIFEGAGGPRRPLLSSHEWFDVSQYWLREATVQSYAEDDLPATTPEEFEFRPSGTGTYHLVQKESGTTVCKNSPTLGEPLPFDLEKMPFAQKVCTHCTPEIKRLQIQQSVQNG